VTDKSLVPTQVLSREDLAYAVKCKIQEYSGAIKVSYIIVGKLLKQARDEEHWITLGYEAWWEYLRDLGISKDMARKMIEVVEHVLTLPFVDESDTPGWTAMVRLIAHAKDGRLTEEIWDAAKVQHDADLRRTLGHSVPVASGVDIQCPLCGGTFKYKERRTSGN
jgi:hypothetical protein